MTQFSFGTIVATTKSGSALASDLNSWRDAVHTQHKGPTRPTYAVPGLSWLNDTAAPWKDVVYDGASDALRGFVDPATHRYSLAGNYAVTITSGGVIAKLSDWGTLFNIRGAAAQTVAIQTKDSLLPGWWIRVIAGNVAVTIDPFGGETIDGAGTKLLSAGSSTTVFYDGANFYTDQSSGGATDFPIGGIVYAPSNAPPTGFLRMNGSLLDRATYAGLWGFAQASGNLAASDSIWTEGKFSPGDGLNTFRIPDGRGNFLRSWADGRALDTGRALGSSQTDDFQSHSHPITVTAGGAHSHTFSDTSSSAGAHTHTTTGRTLKNTVAAFGFDYVGNGVDFYTNPATGSAGAHTHAIGGTTSAYAAHGHTATATAAGAAETRPVNIALLACIKY